MNSLTWVMIHPVEMLGQRAGDGDGDQQDQQEVVGHHRDEQVAVDDQPHQEEQRQAAHHDEAGIHLESVEIAEAGGNVGEEEAVVLHKASSRPMWKT